MPDPALLIRGHASVVDAGLWNSRRRTRWHGVQRSSDGLCRWWQASQSKSGLWESWGLCGDPGSSRRPSICRRGIRQHPVGLEGPSGGLLVTPGAIHAGLRVLVGQQVCPDARPDAEGQRREQHEKDGRIERYAERDRSPAMGRAPHEAAESNSGVLGLRLNASWCLCRCIGLLQSTGHAILLARVLMTAD